MYVIKAALWFYVIKKLELFTSANLSVAINLLREK